MDRDSCAYRKFNLNQSLNQSDDQISYTAIERNWLRWKSRPTVTPFDSIRKYVDKAFVGWCNPPTCGTAMIRPFRGGWIGRECGQSLSSERCVRVR